MSGFNYVVFYDNGSIEPFCSLAPAIEMAKDLGGVVYNRFGSREYAN